MRISRHLRRSTATAAAVLLSLAAACSTAPTQPGPESSRAGGAGALTVSVPQDSASLDPLHTYPYGAVDGNRMAAVYDVLVWSDPATGTTQPQLAESLAPADGGLTWTLRLRDGIRFSDGTPLDAEAVRFNWDRHRDATNHSLQLPATTDIVALQVIDPLTLQVRLARANANFDRTVARHLSFIGSPAAIRRDPVGFGRAPVGAGPYLVSEWSPGRQVFIRNPGYWQHDRGLPRFEQVTMTVDTDPGHSVDEVAADRSDMSLVFAPDAVARATDKRLTVAQTDLDGGSMLVFNTAAKPFDDPRLRLAAVLALSLPRDITGIQLCDDGIVLWDRVTGNT